MKISSASKKVLASALSAAMVVAFAPTVAFGVEAQKLTVSYDLAGGVDSKAGTQDAFTLNPDATVIDGSTVTAAAFPVAYPTSGNISLESGSDSYAFAGWLIGYDENGDGDFNDEKDVDITAGTPKASGNIDVSSDKIPSGATLKAIAQYTNANFVGDTGLALVQKNTAKDNAATIDFNVDSVNGVTDGAKVVGSATVKVTAPDSTVTTAKVKSDDTIASADMISLPAQVGTWTAELVDGNGIVLDKQVVYVGALKLTDGVFTDRNGYKDTELTVYYVAGNSAQTYANILAGCGLNTSGTKKLDGVDKTITYFFDEAGKTSKAGDGSVKAGVKGAVTTVLTAHVNNEYLLSSFTSAAAGTGSYTLTATAVGMASADDFSVLTGTDVTAPATAAHSGFYMVIKDAAGKIVAETTDTDATDNVTAVAGKTLTATVAAAGTYTASLYQVTAKVTTGASGIVDGTVKDGSIKLIGTKTVEVAAVAAPSWAYTANATDATKGTLVLTNNAGDKYDVMYKIGNGADQKYDPAKGGITVTGLGAGSTNATVTIWAAKKAAYAGDDTVLAGSAATTLVGPNATLKAIADYAGSFQLQTVNGATTTYYSKDAGVVAAVAAAKKDVAETGFVASKGGTEWNSTLIAAEQSITDAVAAVAKAEAGKMLAGTTDKDCNLTKISEDNYAKAISSIEKVSADFAANHDSDKTNNVAKNGDITYAAATENYVKAIDAALVTAKAAAVTYKKADVDAAAAVTAQLKDPKTAAAGLEAYKGLTAAQKELVSAADLKTAEEAVAAAALVKAQDQSAARGAKAQVKGATYKIKAKGSKTIKIAKSASGAKVTLKQVSGTKYAKVSGTKVTLKKAAKKGKKYTIKVKAVCGATTTSTVSFKVLVK